MIMFLAAHSVSLLVLFTIQDAVASQWNVTYGQLNIFAVEGSSVDMSCSYTYPRKRILEKVFWTIRNSRDPPDLIQDEKYKERIRTDCGDRKSGSCTLNLKGVKREDAVMYYCRIVTNGTTYGTFLGKPGVTLYVTVTPGGRGTVMYALIAVAAGGGVALLCGAVWLRHRNGNKETRREDVDEHQYANTGFQRSVQSIASAPASAEAAGGAEDVPQYSTIQPHGSRETAGGAEDVPHYSTIQPHGSRETAGGAEDDVQYSTIQPLGSRETAGAQGDNI